MAYQGLEDIAVSQSILNVVMTLPYCFSQTGRGTGTSPVAGKQDSSYQDPSP